MVLIVGSVKPFTKKSANHSELYNEFTALVVNYHLMMFTDFVADVETKEQIGTSLIYVTGANLLVNLCMIFIQSMILLYTRTKLYFLRW